jgi:anti-sigma regulatory factor (Ser/Thr protein kinase)
MPPPSQPEGNQAATSSPADEPVTLARSLPGIRGVRTHQRAGVTVLFVTGPVAKSVGELDRAVKLSLADDPRAVVCDLSEVEGSPDDETLSALSDVGGLVLDWPGTPLVFAAESLLRSRLQGLADRVELVLAPSLHEALAEATRRPAPTTASRRLPPHPTAARAARDFLTSCLLDWKLPKALSAGSLVMSELVTNAMIYARSEIGVSVAWDEHLVRIAVRDGGRGIPEPRDPALDSPGGRGLILVEGFSRAWGVLPAAPGGKVVWAVIDA